uniref:(California timema) hypothetical protein n=1 Tax=Timema californicum TaxID=61474 RepID=A0A7R9P5S2_TIMCA|nr:unnamed protein product [Timema californicum]
MAEVSATVLNPNEIIPYIEDYSELINKPLKVFLSTETDTQRILRQVFKVINTKSLTWLMLPEDDEMSVDDFLEGTYIPFDSEFLVGRVSGPLVHLTEVYRTAEGEPLSKEYFGNWSLEGGSLHTESRERKKRTDLQGIVLRTVVLDVREITTVVEENNRTTVVGGYFGMVWRLLEQELNFTSVFLQVPGQSVGSVLKNGSWTGMMGVIVRGEADVGLTRTYITPRRKDDADFTLPLISTSQNVFIRQPEQNGVLNWGSYLNPFTRTLWLFILAAILMISAVMALIYRQAYRYSTTEGPYLLSFYSSLLCIFGAFCMQASGACPRASSSRMVLTSTFVVAITAAAAYSASVISELTAQQPRLPFTDLRGLVDDGSYKLGVVGKSGLHDIFDNKGNPTLYEVYTRVINPIKDDLPHSVTEGLNRVCKDGKFAFMADLDVALSYAENVSCLLVALPGVSLSSSMSVLLAKNSPYKRVIDFYLMKMQDGGILRRLYLQYFPNKMPTTETSLSRVNLAVVLPILTLFVCYQTHLMFYLEKQLSRLGIPNTSVYLSSLTEPRYRLTYEKQSPTLYVIICLHDKPGEYLKQVLDDIIMKRYIWLLFTKDQPLDGALKGLHVPFNCEFLVAAVRTSLVNLTEVYRVKRDGPLVQDLYGAWWPKGRTIWPSVNMYQRRNDLQGVIVRAIRISHNDNGKLLGLDKETLGSIWWLFEKQLNFSTEMTQAKDGEWGALENGTWNGLIGIAARGETDFILNRLTMSSEKNLVVDFTLPIVDSKLRAYIKPPDAVKITWRSYMQPFSLKLWLALCGTISVIAVILAMVYNRTSAARGHPILCLIDSLLCVYGTFCSQGTYTSPTSASCRLILMSNFLSSFILVSSYSAFVISYLTVQRVEMPFRDLAGMLDDGTYKFAVLAHSTQLTMFKNTSDKQRAEVYKRLIAPIEQDLPSGTPVGLTTTCSERMTFFTLDDVANSYMKDAPCQLVTIPGIVYPISVVITATKNNPYREAINNLFKKKHVPVPVSSPFTPQLISRPILCKRNTNHDEYSLTPGCFDTTSLVYDLTLSDLPKMFGMGKPIKSQTKPSQISAHVHIPAHALYNQKQADIFLSRCEEILMKLKEGGILSKLHVSDPISDEGENKVTNVSLSNTLPLFLLLTTGLTTAFVLLVLENGPFLHYSSSMASLVLTDSSQLTADGFEKLPDQLMYSYAKPYDLQKHVFSSCHF